MRKTCRMHAGRLQKRFHNKKKKNFFIFSSQNKKLEIHRKVQLLFIISMIFFLQQSRASKVQTPFSREANVNPSGSTHVYFNVVFYRIARAGPNVSYDNSTALCLIQAIQRPKGRPKSSICSLELSVENVPID